MAAPRRYTDAQRMAMFRLYDAGVGPSEITRQCAAGEAGVEPFEVVRKTCETIVKGMASAARDAPTTTEEAESVEAVERFPMRAARILGAELERLERKQKAGRLTARDIEQIRKAADVSKPLSKRLREGRRQHVGTAGRTRGVAATTASPESAIEKLAREEQGQKAAEERLVATRTSQLSVSSRSSGPSQPSTAGLPRPTPETALDAVREVATKHGLEMPGA